MSTIAKKKLSASSGISCHAWNGPRNQIALCPYTNEVHVYEVNASSGEYKQVGTLSEHEQLVAGVDWASERDMIVTCAHDRNAYVWERSKEGGGKVRPTSGECGETRRDERKIDRLKTFSQFAPRPVL